MALITRTDSVGWWSLQMFTDFVHALCRDIEHQKSLASLTAPGVKLD